MQCRDRSIFQSAFENSLCFILILPLSTIAYNERMPFKKKDFLNRRATQFRQKAVLGSNVLARQPNRERVGRSHGEDEGKFKS